ncbi:MAG: hypothetical protein WKF68_05740 [Daejeonella sp.]
MVEVFKTNVEDPDDACRIIEQFSREFPDYQANFDLEDCDKVLRVECRREVIDCENLISLLGNSGFKAETLEDKFAIDITL